MDTDGLKTRLEGLSDHELLIDATVRYLLSFPPEVADAAFRCAVLRWFNAETLEGVLGVGAISGIESGAADRRTPTDLYEQLRQLRFAEEYPGRGYSFHDLTRELILDHLWHHEQDFYRQVSAKAVDHFRSLLNTQIERRDRSEIDPSEVDWDLIVEIAYHYFIQDEREAVEVIDSNLDYLLQQRALGTYHAVIQAASEHAKADRISSDSKFWIELWRIKEANANYDIAQSESIARKLLELHDSDINPGLIAEATYLFADSLLMASRYDEAKSQFEENLRQYDKLEDPDGALNALVGLGNVEFSRENYETARDCFAEALAFRVEQLRIAPGEDSEFGSDVVLRVFEPEAWQRRELYPVEETEDPEKAPPSNGPDTDISQVRVLYFIEFDTEKLEIDTSNLSEDDAGKYEWPIEFDGVLAHLWLRFGQLSHALDSYDIAASCARLAGQLSMDLEDLSGAQQAVQLLQIMGANLGDLEYVKSMDEFQQELLGRAVARNDQRAELQGLINQASAQFRMDKYGEAQATYEKALSLAESLDLSNEKATCLDGLARLSWTNADYDLAVKGFASALELYQEAHNREGEADTLLSLGDLYAARRMADAEQYYRQALDIYEELHTFSGELRCRLKLAEAATTTGEYESAFAYLDQVLQLSIKNHRLSSEAETVSKIAVLHLSLGHNDEAEEAFSRALEISNRIRNKQLAASILIDRASSLSELAQYAPAVQMYDLAIDADQSNFRAYAGKGWALERLGKDKAEEARQAYEKAIDFSTNDWWVHRSMADILRVRGDKQEASAKYQWVIEQIENEGATPALRPLLAWCHYHLGQYETAREMFKQVVSSDPDPISDYFDLGIVFLCGGQYPEALEAYEQSIKLLQNRCPPRRTLGLIYVAIEDLREAVETHPELSEVEEYKRIQELLTRELQLTSEKSESKPIISAKV